jgi:putative ABC transport system permease protein
MFRLITRNLWANKVRFSLTTFGVVLAVSFVVSALVLGDGLRSTFTDVSEEITAGVDLEVRNVADLGETPPLPADTVSTVAAVDGVADAAAIIESAHNAVRPIMANGDIIPTGGPPQLAFNWIDNEELSAFRLVDGAPPSIGEFTIDVDAASKYGFIIGDTYEFMVPDGRVHLTMSGTSSFGAENTTLGAVLMQMNTAEASDLFDIDGVNSVAVQVADDVDVAAVQAAVAAAVPTAEVVDHAAVTEETTAEFTDEINLVGNMLLGFGGVAVFVSIFIIYNTFGIVLSQRTRELAVLRTVGADPRQIRRSALSEALAMGVLASVGGVGGGIVVAKGIDALFGVMGVDLSDWPLILAPRTLIVAALTGVGVTMLAARGPARRAATVPPIAAINGGADAGAITSRRRVITGVALVAVGLFAGAAGLASSSVGVAGLALAVIAAILAVTVLSPLVVRAVTWSLGAPLGKVAGVAGRLARKNAGRNTRRTATTASALMIGLTLVTTALVLAASVKATIGSTFERSAKADYYLSDDLDEVDFPATLAAELRQSDIVAAASGFTHFDARIDGTVTSAVGFDFDQIDALLDVDVRAGGFDNGVDHPVVVSVDEARRIDAGPGDVIAVEAAGGSPVQATIVGLFDDQAILSEDYLFDSGVLADASVDRSAEWLAVSMTDGASPAAIQAFIADLSEQHPNAFVETPTEFRQRVEGMIDQILTMVNVMVALAVVIALIGIANTLALSVFERTRELGLLRAVGMSRRQLRRMVRYEAALVATFGAILGVGLGLLFGFGLVTVLPASIASALAVPTSHIAIVMLVAAGAGVAAAWLPARRAGRLDVLAAIAH